MTMMEYRWPAGYHSVPIDHGYMLYSALSHALQPVHEGSWQVCTLTGSAHKRELRGSGSLRIRGPLAPALIEALDGGVLRVGNREVVLGRGVVSEVKPWPDLRARLVTVKNATEPDAMLRHIEYRLHDLLEHIPEVEIGRRRVMRIRDKMVVGFGVTIRGLTDEDSLIVQAEGIGGRRRMGGGIFLPASELGAQGRWFMTPYAVKRMVERHGRSLGVTSYDAARAWMIEDSAHARRAHAGEGDAEVWVGRRPWRIRYVIGDAPEETGGSMRPVVTVLPKERRS